MLAIIPFPNIGAELFSFTIFGFEGAIRWYALSYIAGLLIGWRMIVALIKRPALWPQGQPPMTPAHVEDLFAWVIAGVVIGGRLGIVLFYDPAYYFSNPIEILKVWKGGMAFHGGLLGVVVAAWIFAQRNGIPKLSAADCLAIATPPGLLLGRLANFVNAELWGRPWDGPWAMIFPTDFLQVPRHPSQLYESALEGLVLGLILLWLALARRSFLRPGFVAGVFFLGYGLARVFVEYFRQADDQFITADNPMGYIIGQGAIGLTMGQILSLPMVALGLILIALSRRKT